MPAYTPPPPLDPAAAYAACTDALGDFASAAGFTEAVIGLSGGIDSALAALMCVDALGSGHVHGVLLPGPYSSKHSVSDALALAQRAGIATQTVAITGAYEAFGRALADACGGPLAGPVSENVQARCRMVCLMALSNAYGWMLVNTGNRSESLMGYSTLYGDAAGAFAPLGGLYKTEVYALARWRNESAVRAGRVPPIPENTLEKPPSAELSPGQEDEKSLGVAYGTLDQILFALDGQRSDPAGLVAAGFSEADVAKVADAMKASAFKRAVAPPSPEMTPLRP